MKTITFYEIQSGSGIYCKDGQSNFETEKNAIDAAIEFKQNPRISNPAMPDESVEYWKNKTYVIIKKTIITEEIKSV